jgi:hypothetical protein
MNKHQDNGVPPDARTHREEFVAYVVAKAEAWHREQMGRLYREWERWNAAHFGRALVTPYLLLTGPSNPRAYGDYGRVSCFGGYGQTRIRPTLLTGEHPHRRAGEQFAAGRFLFVADVFLHESVHQYQHEVLNDLAPGYKGHGPRFAAKCNEIGAALGLPSVRPAKARGKNKNLPSCAQWPHNVRPADYYQSAYLWPQTNEDKAEPGPEPAPEPPDTLDEALRGLLEAAYKVGACLPSEVLHGIEALHRRGQFGGPGPRTRVLLADPTRG